MKVDVCLVGGGFCGLVLAHTLKQLGFSCVVLEARSTLSRADDARALVLSYGSCLILQRLGLWSSKIDAWPLQQLSYSLKGFWGEVQLRAADYDVPALGHVVHAGDWFKTCIDQADLPQTFLSVKPKSLILGDKTHELEFEHAGGHAHIDAEIVIGADGSNSWVRAQCGADVQMHLDAAAALMMPVKGAGPHAWVRASSVGSLAYVPQNDQGGLLIWTGQACDIERMKNATVRARLTHQVAGHRLTLKQCTVDTVYTMPVVAHQSTGTMPEGVVWVGNALHTLPPVAAQGFNLGIRDCVSVIEQCVKARLQQQSLREGLSDVMRSRHDDIERTMQLSLTAMQAHRWAQRARGLTGLGLWMIDRFPGFTRDRVQSALGLTRPYSDLFRGASLDTWRAQLEGRS
jgi:2-octaprenyl-6-methoxyphenol hydroxylase